MALKFNISPYYDDFREVGSDDLSPAQKYHKILFRPGHAVQARELTQLQSILQDQVTRFGKHMFQEGSMVIPGGFKIDTRTEYVALASYSLAANTTLDDLAALTVTGDTSGVSAKVYYALEPEDVAPVTLYVQYQNSGTDNETKRFQQGEGLTFSNGTTCVVETDGFIANTPACSIAVTATINRGVYFIRDHFVVVQGGMLNLTRYGNDVSRRVGLIISEDIITSAEDAELNDNANGTPNYTAPGAHRYQIKATLAHEPIDADENLNFLTLGTIVNGKVLYEVRKSEYSELAKTFARRTFDESGNYTVRPFKMSMREHTDVYTPGDDTKLIAAVEPSKAYVQGYEIETIATTNVDVNKAREYDLFEGASVPIQYGNWIDVTNMDGLPPIDTFLRCELRDATGGGGNIRGYGRVRSVMWTGTNYRLFMFDVQMNAGYTFDTMKSIAAAGTPAFVADFVLDAGKATLKDVTNNTMVMPLPYTRVRTLDSEIDDLQPDNYNFVYFANRRFGAVTVSGGFDVTVNTSGASEIFEPFDDENWLLAVATQVGGTQPTGTIIPITSGNVTGAGTQTVTISGLDSFGLGADDTVVLIAGVKRTLQQKTKSLTTHQTVISNQATVEGGVMSVERADPYRIIGVFMSADFSTTPTAGDEDVSEYYDLFDGQKDNYYDIGYIKIKPNTAFRPTGQLMIQVEYFQHQGAGDFFSVDSYEGVVNYEDIPTFTSRVHGTVELRSCIDFRPRIGDGGIAFDGTGGDLCVCPEAATTLTTDIQYYLNRIDKIALSSDGRFGVIEGVPALEPQPPADPKGVMVMYWLYVTAYTEGPQEVSIKVIDNKRYTMRDIGALERRINTLEYYTSLSLLEAETAQKQIQDSSTGLDRFKNGFIVDSFTSHRLGNVSDSEYRFSIDRDTNSGRPQHVGKSSRMRYDSVQSSNLQKNGDLITLPILSEATAAEQPKASGFVKVNPFAVFDWTGNIELSPSTDEWKDTDRRPNVTVNQEGVYDAMLATINETDALGTVWNEWKTNWTGKDVSSVDDKGSLVNKSGTTSTGGWKESGYNVKTTTTTVTTKVQSRSGTETYVTPATYTTNLGDRVVEINFTPYMRTRMVKFKATRLKPNTRVYPFFDGVAVADYCRQITSGEYTVWSDTDEVTKTGINNDTAHPEGSTTLVSDAQGTLYGEFYIPNNTTLNFATGTRIFELSDDVSNDKLLETTSCKASYYALGLIQSTENVTISTRVPELEYREVTNNRTLSSSASSTSTRWEQESYSSWTNTVKPASTTTSSGGGTTSGTFTGSTSSGGDSGGSATTNYTWYDGIGLVKNPPANQYYGVGTSPASGGGGNDSKIICTKLYELGMMPEYIYQADQAFGELVMADDMDLMNGYHKWAQPVVDVMGKDTMLSKFLTKHIHRIATPWAEHMAYIMGAQSNDNEVGRALMTIGGAVSKVVNKLPTTKAPKVVGLTATFIVATTVYGAALAIGKTKELLRSSKESVNG